jgi:hypothetical protein
VHVDAHAAAVDLAGAQGTNSRLIATRARLMVFDIVLRADDGSGALRLVEGARAVATRAQFFSDARTAHPAIIDGAAGFVATEAGIPVAVLAFTTADGRITSIDALDGPARVAGLDLEAFVAD